MSLLTNRPVRVKRSTILVPLQSYLHLQEKSYLERIGKHHSEKARQRIIFSFKQFAGNGKRCLMDGDLCGCNGNPENAWEEGRWTSWSVDDMAKILDEAGLPWEKGEDIECIE